MRRHRFNWNFVLLMVGFWLAVGPNPSWAVNAAAHRVLIHGKVITVDPLDTIAEAVAIHGEKIVAVGSNADIQSWIGPETEVIDLNGLTVTPGLIDSHIHFSGTSMLYVLDLSYPGVQNIETDVVKKVADQVAVLGPGEWIRGRGWDEGKMKELRYIYAGDLDPVTPENPVWLTHTMGHYGTANSYAMELAGVTKETPDPPGGTIDRDPDGTPSGVFKENAMALITKLIPPFTPEQEERGIAKLCEEYNKEGMTGAKDGGAGLAKWKAFQNVLAKDELTVRTFFMWRSKTGEKPKTLEDAQWLIDHVAPFTKPYLSTGDDRLISGGIKLSLDGSGGARTAWQHRDWNKNFDEIDTGNSGYPLLDKDIFVQIVKRLHAAGLHLSTHSIGDKAIDWNLNAYELALTETPIKGLRHGIIHCNTPSDRAIDTMAWMQKQYDAGYPEAQSVFMWWIGDTYAGNLGAERSLRLMPFNTYLKKGVLWGGGSDYSVVPFPARSGIWASIARKTLLGVYGWNPWGMEESIDVRNALRSYTIWNAHQMFLEDKIGSIEVGKYADMAVWDKDLYTIPTDEIKDLKCQMTLLGGKIVYRAEEAVAMITKKKSYE